MIIITITKHGTIWNGIKNDMHMHIVVLTGYSSDESVRWTSNGNLETVDVEVTQFAMKQVFIPFLFAFLMKYSFFHARNDDLDLTHYMCNPGTRKALTAADRSVSGCVQG